MKAVGVPKNVPTYEVIVTMTPEEAGELRHALVLGQRTPVECALIDALGDTLAYLYPKIRDHRV